MNKAPHRFQSDDACVSKPTVSALQASERAGAISCYENSIPAFVEAELERLYNNLFSSLPYLRISGKLTRQTSTYVVRRGDEIVTIFLFQQRHRKVSVINERMKISAEELSLFSDYIFSSYRSVDFIFFNAVEAAADAIPFPCQRLGCPCDLVLDLPATEDDYLASLGKRLRYNIRRSLVRLPAEHPSFRMDFHDAADVDEKHVRAIIDLNKARMQRVKKVYKRDEEDVQKIIELCQSLGLVGVMTIGGKVCGGSIGYRAGSSHTGRIVSHDPQYDKFSIGTLCIFLCIRECIARGYRQFNFMSGDSEYKHLLGGVPRELDQIVICRSRPQLLLNPDIAASLLSAKCLNRARLRIQRKLSALNKLKLQGKLDARSKALFHVLDNLRTLKDHISGLAKRG